MRRIEKYSGPMKFIGISGEPRSGRPRKSMRTSLPLFGGVPLLVTGGGFDLRQSGDSRAKLFGVLRTSLPGAERLAVKGNYNREAALRIVSKIDAK